MATDPAPKYTDADVERIVAKKVGEAQQANLLDALSKELTGMRREIASANHIKRTIGRQISELNSLVRAHIAAPMHAGTAEKLTEWEAKIEATEEQFGLEALTPEERAAFPLVVRTVLANQQRVNAQKQAEKERADLDSQFWQRVAGFASAISIAIAMLSAMGAFNWFRQNIFHVHP